MDSQEKTKNNNQIDSSNYSQPMPHVQLNVPLMYHPYPQITQPYMYGRHPQYVTW